MSYYQILGISRDASADDIRRAYRILARRYHPDVNPGSDSKQKFQKISEAYATLSDAEKRQHYDLQFSTTAHSQRAKEGGPRTQRPRRPQPAPIPPTKRGFFDEIKELFAEVKRPGRTVPKGKKPSREGYAPQKVSVVEVSLDVHEAILGGVKKVEVSEPEGRRTITITIPSGVKTGDIIRLGRKEVKEDLIAIVRLLPHPYLSITRRGIVIELPITIEEAVNGAGIMVPTLDEPVVLRIPPGSQSGSELRLKGRGASHRGGERGDLLYRLLIKIPEQPSHTVAAAAAAIEKEYKPKIRESLPKSLL